MSNQGYGLKSLFAFVSLPLAVMLVAGCSGTNTSPTTPTTPNAVTGSAFVIGTDAPVAGVVSFAVQIQSVNAVTSGERAYLLSAANPQSILRATTACRRCLI